MARSSDTRDPVEAAAEGDRDLYEVTTWENRSVVDGAATTIHSALAGHGRFVVIALAALVFLAQLGGVLWLLGQNAGVGVVALLSAVPAFLLVALVWKQDVVDNEPMDTLSITFVLAVLFASFAALLNSVLGGVFKAIPVVGTVLFFFLVVGPLEETVKWLAVRVHAYRTSTFDAVIDGAVYGAVAGLGFATIENVLYVAQGFVKAGGVEAGAEALQTAVGTAFSRGLAGPGHVIYSAWAGFYLGLAKFNPEKRGPIVVKGLLVASVIHATYNVAVTFGQAYLGGLAFVGFVLCYDGLFFYLLYRKLSRYKEVYEEEVVDSSSSSGPTAATSDD
jgi:RsiW-degrading membrane proteinase PrsW (M82 family)